MKKHFTGKSLAAMIAAVIIALIALIAISTGGGSGFITRFASGITKPIRTTAASVASQFESLYGYMHEYDRLAEENERLSVENSELRANAREYNELLAENERFRELLDFKSRHSDYVFDTATVISWSSSNWASSFTISKGSANSDVQVGDSIVTSTGVLVGQVEEVGQSTSTCITVIDAGFSASALVGSSGSSVVANGDFSAMRHGLLTLDYISESTAMYTGDAVTTSGRGEVFPRGLLIGYIADITGSESGLGMTATVEPAAKPGSIMDIFIITDFTLTE